MCSYERIIKYLGGSFMFKKFNELTKMEKVNLGITGLTVLAGLGLWIYGSIEEKKALKEIAEVNNQILKDNEDLNDLLKNTGTTVLEKIDEMYKNGEFDQLND